MASVRYRQGEGLNKQSFALPLACVLVDTFD